MPDFIEIINNRLFPQVNAKKMQEIAGTKPRVVFARPWKTEVATREKIQSYASDLSLHTSWIIPLLGTIGLSLALTLTGALNLHHPSGKALLGALIGSGSLLTLGGGFLAAKISKPIDDPAHLKEFQKEVNNKGLIGLGTLMILAGVFIGGVLIACSIRPELLSGLSHGIKHAIQHSDQMKQVAQIITGALGSALLVASVIFGSGALHAGSKSPVVKYERDTEVKGKETTDTEMNILLGRHPVTHDLSGMTGYALINMDT